MRAKEVSSIVVTEKPSVLKVKALTVFCTLKGKEKVEGRKILNRIFLSLQTS